MQKNDDLALAMLSVTVGILFVSLRGGVVGVAMTVVGAALVVLAVRDFIAQKIPVCVVKAIFGVLVIVFGWALAAVALYLFAALLLVYACVQIYDIARYKPFREENLFSAVLCFLRPTLTAVIAVMLLFAQGKTADVIFLVSGILLLADGVLLLADILSRPRTQ